jgi:hypothetical protein
VAPAVDLRAAKEQGIAVSCCCHSSFPFLRHTGAAARIVALTVFGSPPRSASLARIGGEKLLLSDRPTGSFDPLVLEGVECRNSHAVMTRIRGRDPARHRLGDLDGAGLRVHLGRGVANVLGGVGWAFRHVLNCSGVCLRFWQVTPPPALMPSTGLCHQRQRCRCGSSRPRW